MPSSVLFSPDDIDCHLKGITSPSVRSGHCPEVAAIKSCQFMENLVLKMFFATAFQISEMKLQEKLRDSCLVFSEAKNFVLRFLVEK